MTKEQFFTFKSDFKKGMTITRLEKKHKKAYWNDGFKSQKEQNEAIEKNNAEISSIRETVALKYKRFYDGAIVGVHWGFLPQHHWAYYCAKHQLDENASIEYIKGEMEKATKTNFWSSAEYYYSKQVKPILDDYEKIVCTD